MVIVPTMQISWTLFSILSGGIYYQEYKGYNTLKSVMFAVGVAVRACSDLAPAWLPACLLLACMQRAGLPAQPCSLQPCRGSVCQCPECQ